MEQDGVRVVALRLGMVLSSHGGALATMLPAFRWGLGAILGSGSQYVSWVSLKMSLAVFASCWNNLG